MHTPTYSEIRCALETALFDVLGKYATGKKASVFIVQPAQDAEPAIDRIHIYHSVNLGTTSDGEMCGRQGLVPRVGVYAVTLSCPPSDAGRYAQGLEYAAEIEQAFYRMDLPITGTRAESEDGVSPVFCKEPYTENVGEMSNKRLGLLVNIPFWVWTGGFNE